MSVYLKVWTSKEGQVRVYANAYREYGSMADLDIARAYFVQSSDGKVEIGGFKACYSGRYGAAASAAFDHFGLDGMSWNRFVELVSSCLTKSGNFSESKYFKAI